MKWIREPRTQMRQTEKKPEGHQWASLIFISLFLSPLRIVTGCLAPFSFTNWTFLERQAAHMENQDLKWGSTHPIPVLPHYGSNVKLREYRHYLLGLLQTLSLENAQHEVGSTMSSGTRPSHLCCTCPEAGAHVKVNEIVEPFPVSSIFLN